MLFNYKLLKFSIIANTKYVIIRIVVKLFRKRSAELADPNKLLFVAKLANPLFCGVLKNTTKIKNPLNNNQNNFSILFNNLNYIQQYNKKIKLFLFLNLKYFVENF